MALDAEAFRRLLGQNNVNLPVRLVSDDEGVIVDHDGNHLLTIDQNRERPDSEVVAIAAQIAIAINAAGGIRTEETIDG